MVKDIIKLPEGTITRQELTDLAKSQLLDKLRPEYQPAQPPARRWQDKVILGEIAPGSTVLDLGCGRGELLGKLIVDMGVKGQAVEVDPEAAMAAMELGVPVLNLDINEVLGDFPDLSFDCVILESTLQTLKEPLRVLSEILRVGRRAIVSFPNFGHWRVRLDLAIRGRMPVTPGLPYGWHDTPNIHLFTLADFMDWRAANEVKVAPGFALVDGQVEPLAEDSNISAEEVLVFLEKERPIGVGK
ncbi:MAG: methionine biosynthesis protein MetW [Deltaproteobacteria bacterium]|jgi:methionine biosynthesis protein MetW|nr:methionine biosynthesis protein MetW [Deltaproteobacteria bacterium]